MNKRRYWALLVLLLSLCKAAGAQTTFASITGTVTDSSGALIPNAKVSATNVDTNITTSAESNAAGVYTISQLKEGSYAVRSEAAGFKEFLAKDVLLAAREIRRLDIPMQVGGVATSVEVSAGIALIETESAHLGNTKNAAALKALPVNSPGIYAFLALTPSLQNQANSSVVRFAGSRANQANWSIDGTTFADGVDNTMTGPLANYTEWVQESRIDLANNSAEFGSLGQVTLISKSGSNKLRGSLFDYYITPWFRARDPFSPTRTPGVRHLPGGSVGGPVYIPKLYNGRDRTFFYFSFETSRGSQTTTLLNPSVPIESWRRGDFSSAGVTVFDPKSGIPFPNNIIPAERINPVSRKIQDRFYPLPNYGDPNTFQTANYRENKSRPYDPSTYWTPRLDHRFSAKDSIFGRYTFSRGYNRGWEGNLPTIGRRNQVRTNRAATVSYTHTFTPTMLNELRWGFGYNNNPRETPVNGAEFVNELGLVGLAPNLPDISGLLRVSWSGLGLQSISQNTYSNPGYRTHTEDVQELLTWFRGRHNLRFGVNLLRAEYDSYSADASLFGNVTFSNKFTGLGAEGRGHPYADFLLGIPRTARRAFPPMRLDRNRWSCDVFAADDFRINPKLTLNLGLRYEYHLPWRENGNLMSIFDVGSGNIVVPDGSLSKVSPIFPRSYVGIVEASSLGLPSRSLIRTDRNNFAPRIGIAYRPWGNNTVVRAGFGVFYDIAPFVYALDNAGFGGVPYSLSEPAYTNPQVNPDVVFPRVFPATGTGGPSTVSLPAAENPGFRTPYSMQYNLTIERQQWNTGFRLSYIGTAYRQGAWAYNYNSPVPDDRPYAAKPRPFPKFPEVPYITNGAGHQYNGLTVEANRQMARGLHFQASWTWARDRYDLDYNGDFTADMFTSENPFDRHREVGVSRDIPTHRLTVNWIYQLPFGKGRPWLSRISRSLNLAVGGWEVSGVYSAQTGEFLTPLWTGSDPVGIAHTDGDPAEVTMRPDVYRNPNLPRSQRNIAGWFDVSAFGPPRPGQFGTSAKGSVIGPGINIWHLGLHKYFQLRESGTRLRWEWTATNSFNHPNWGTPGLDISDTAGLGVISSVGGASSGPVGDNPFARTLRMGVRLEW